MFRSPLLKYLLLQKKSVEDLLWLLVFILPAYFANSSPVIFGGGTPMDFGKRAWDRRRCLGDGKTWRGFIAGTAIGTLVGIAEAGLLGSNEYIAYGFLLSFGALAGDAFGSFLKRRLGMDRGSPMFIMDQLPFLFFALFLASSAYLPSPEGIVLLALLTYALHVSTNFVANRLGLKRVPW